MPRSLGDALQALVLKTLRAQLDAGESISPEESRALLELAEAQRRAIADLRRDAVVHQSVIVSYGELAGEWLELVGILRLAGLEVGRDQVRGGAGGWYWRVGAQQRSGYEDVISAYRAGLPVLLADLIARQVVPDCSAETGPQLLGELRSLADAA